MLYGIEKLKQHLRIEADGKMTGLTETGKNAVVRYELNRKGAVMLRSLELYEIVQGFRDKLRSFIELGKDIENSKETEFLLDITFRPLIKDLDVATYNSDLDERAFVWGNAYWYFNKLIIKNGDFSQSEQRLLKLVETALIKKQAVSGDTILNILRSKEEERKTGTLQYGYLKSLTVQNYFSLKDITIKGLSRTKEIYFLGENGDGKTLLLQAIVLAFLKKHIETEANKGDVGSILQNIDDNIGLSIRAEDSNGVKYGKTNAILKNVYAYGTNRRSNTDTEKYDKEGYLTLFHEEKSLISPVTWLKDIQLKGNQSVISLDEAKKMLSNLLDGDVEIETDLDEVRFKDIRFTERETQGLRFEQLSDGYKSVMTWVADLVARMAENQPEARSTKDFRGIVLVDEVGLHLHPKWEAGLVQKLRKWFPKVQFFFTTHSPVVILNADKSAVFYRLYKEEGVTKISQKFYCKDFSDLRMNSLVTSPLFDLGSATMSSFDPETDEFDTNEDFMTYRIKKLVREKMANLKAENKVVLSVDFLDDLINSAIEQVD